MSQNKNQKLQKKTSLVKIRLKKEFLQIIILLTKIIAKIKIIIFIKRLENLQVLKTFMKLFLI